MGFPTWTLWGMGLAALAALLLIALAYLAQTPSALRRLELDVYRLDLRVRAFTGYAFALLLLAFGFFLAGVPLSPGAANSPDVDSAVDVTEIAAVSTVSGAVTFGPPATADDSTQSSLTITPAATSSTPVTGAFGGLPPAIATRAAEETAAAAGEAGEPTAENETPAPENEETAAAETPAAPAVTDAPLATPTATPTITPSPTPTSSPTPTVTPTPTQTPTPIVGETALVNGDGGNVWIYRSPGGQQLALVADGEILILLPGHASQGGLLWQEVMTVAGVTGWIDVSFLILDETP